MNVTRPNTAIDGSPLLRSIWQLIVRPILRALDLQVRHNSSFCGPSIQLCTPQKQHGRNRPRLHWCPTGAFTFLPIHAATAPDSGKSCSDYVVSSYTPTLTALVRARGAWKPIRVLDCKALLVAEGKAPGLRKLTEVGREVSAVSKILSPMSPIVLGDIASTGCGVTVQEVLDHLPMTSILHLACHGRQRTFFSLRSGFCLRDGCLTIAELIKLNLRNARFAFLSACETAKEDIHEPNQAMHIAAAMLFVGFQSVVATMWYAFLHE